MNIRDMPNTKCCLNSSMIISIELRINSIIDSCMAKKYTDRLLFR